ncbi:MAG TPA: Maf family protein [Candidatus Nanoarchaeia archaeon]
MQEEFGPDMEEFELPEREEIIKSPQEAEGELERIWSGDIDIDSLKRQFQLQEERKTKEYARDHPFLGSISKEWGEAKVEPFDSVVLATSSRKKQGIVAKIAQETGVDIQPTLQTELVSEGSLKKLIRDLETEPEIRAIDLAELKELGTPHSEKPVLSMDTVVIDQKGRIVDKPTDKESAFLIISSLSSQSIKVVNGLTLHYRTSDGRVLLLRDGVEIRLKLKNLSNHEVSRYIETQRESVQQIVGGIDFSSDMGRDLIDDDFAFEEQLEELQRKYRRLYYKTAYEYKLPTPRIVPFILRLLSA